MRGVGSPAGGGGTTAGASPASRGQAERQDTRRARRRLRPAAGQASARRQLGPVLAQASVRSRLRPAAGQASVETVAVLPLLIVVALAAAQLLAAGVARELAGHAAEAGAVAVLERADAAGAARAAVPGWARSRVGVVVDGRAVRVTLRPPSPVRPVADLLAATAVARAGG